MGLFKEVEGETCVLVMNGIYRQVTIHTRDGWLYARYQGGYVKLYADGCTSKDKLRIDFLTWEGTLYKDRLGRLITRNMKGATLLGETKLLTSG